MEAYLVWRRRGFSRLVKRRALVVLTVLAALFILTLIASVASGSTAMPITAVVAALLGQGTPTDTLIVTGFRLPRVLQAAEAGVCLAVAGFLLQRATRNPLASPTVLGVVDGAGLAVVLTLVGASLGLAVLDGAALGVANADVDPAWLPVAAVTGAFCFVALTFGLAREQAASPIRLILFGVALAAIAKAAMTVLLVTAPIFRVSQAMRWLAGAVDTATWPEVAITAAAAVPVLFAAALIARRLDLLDVDDRSARSAGLATTGLRIASVALAAVLTAIAVAYVGGIGFVGLIAPHLAVMLVGRSSGAGMAAAALLGALMVMAADLLVRVAFAPTEVPAGTVTAVVGAPYLLYLLTRRSSSDG